MNVIFYTWIWICISVFYVLNLLIFDVIERVEYECARMRTRWCIDSPLVLSALLYVSTVSFVTSMKGTQISLHRQTKEKNNDDTRLVGMNRIKRLTLAAPSSPSPWNSFDFSNQADSPWLTFDSVTNAYSVSTVTRRKERHPFWTIRNHLHTHINTNEDTRCDMYY